MDVISLHQAGFTNAIASLGTALTSGHASLIKRYVKEVYLTYDSDEAGTKAALRAIPTLKAAGITAKVIRMEPYKDPDEFIENLGAEAFEERIGRARNGFLFSLEMLEKDYDMESPEGKTEFLKETAKRLGSFEEEVERNNYIEAVAKAYHVDYESMRKLVVKTAVASGLATPVPRPKSTQNKEQVKNDHGSRSQKILLTWLIDQPALFPIISKYVLPQDFAEGLYATVAKLLYEQYESEDINPAKILNYFTEEEEHHQVAGLFHTKIQQLKTKEEQEKALQETILKVKEESLEQRSRKLEPTDMAGLQQLMEAKRQLDGLRKLHISID